MNKWKIIIIFIVFIILSGILIIFFLNKDYKKEETGNNKSIKEIEEYILNIKTYKANLDVTITNNRNENKYKINQEVTNEYEKQKIIEPEEIKNLEIIYKDRKLEIKNTDLNLNKIYENYPNIEENNLFLTQFIKNYQTQNEKKIEKTDENIIMQVKENKNRYNVTQKLYVNSKNLKPEKIEIFDNNNNIRVYILYNEIEINI